MLFFQGHQLQNRVKKICEGFRATLYQCPESVDKRQKMMVEVEKRVAELQEVMEASKSHCIAKFKDIASQIEAWKIKARET